MANLSRAVSETTESHVSDASNPVPVEALSEMDDSAIMQLLTQTQEANTMIEKEIIMFGKFFKRIDPKDVQAKSAATSLLEDRRKKGRQRPAQAERMLKLSLEQKCDIATREQDELKEELTKRREDNEKVLDHHKAVLIGAEHRLGEMKKSVYEFERDIIRGAVDARTGTILGERVLKYFEDYKRSRDNLSEKLRLKNSTMQVKKQKLQSYLKQKEEAGEVRLEVDFEQLKIENDQLRDRLEEKNQALLKLKLSSGNTMQVLNSYKQKVQALSGQCRRLEADIKQREDLVAKIDAEYRQSGQDKEQAEELYLSSKRMLEDFRVPEVMDYVKETADLYELTKTLKTWERKVEITEMTLHTLEQTWRQLSKRSEQKHTQRHATLPPSHQWTHTSGVKHMMHS